MAFYARRFAPKLRINPLLARWDCVGELVSLGGRMQVLSVVALVVSTLDAVVFTSYGGFGFYGAYGAAQKFAQRAQGVAHQGFGALIPASADLLAREDYSTLAHVYATAMRLCCVGCVYLFGFLFINSDIAMMFVMGEDEFMPMTVSALQFLAIAYFVHTLSGPGTSMLRGAGMPLREIAYQLLTAALFLGFFFLMHRYGDRQFVVLTFPVALAIGAALFIYIANRFFRVSPVLPFDQTFPLILAGILLAWLTRTAWDAIPLGLPFTRWPSLLAIACNGCVFTGLFALASWFLPGLTATDKDQLVRFVPYGHTILRLLHIPEPLEGQNHGD